MSFAQARSAARAFFPNWSRKMRAKWVLAKLRAGEPRVSVSASWAHDRSAYYFARCGR